MGKKEGRSGNAAMEGSWSEFDLKCMARALELASRGGGRTSPNPRVGAVLAVEGRVLSEGYHRAVGLPHAEVEALDRAGEIPEGTTLYVTLEPCNVQGRTPPCSSRVIESGVTRVVVPLLDPDPRVSGSGNQELRRAGLVVETGLMAEEALELNRGYYHRVLTGAPFVSLKVATTLNGGILGVEAGDPRITGEAALMHVHELRARVQGVLIGIGTLEKDRPRLDARKSGDPEYQPSRLVLDSRLRFVRSSHWHDFASTVVVFHAPDADRDDRIRLEEKGFNLVEVPKDGEGLSLRSVLEWLGRQGMNEVLVEGGGRTLTSFLRAGRFQRFYHYSSPRIGPAPGEGWYGAEEPPPWQGEVPLRTTRSEKLGEDMLRVLSCGWEERTMKLLSRERARREG